jgi:hypothetical protein
MPDNYCIDAGISRRQRVFAVIEGEPGLLAFPSPTDAIRPAGDATMNQVPTFTDSSEKFDTLDLLDKFQNAMPPGEWSVPMYLRTSGFQMSPQGYALIESAMGRKGTAVYAALASDIAATDTTIPIKSIVGGFSPVGVLVFPAPNYEKVRYSGFTKTADGEGTLTGCIRGYADTTADAYEAPVTIEGASTAYFLDYCAPSVSLWIETDFFVQFMSGCTVNEIQIPVQNEDAVKFNMTGQGMRMGWIGRSLVKTAAAIGAEAIIVQDPKRYSIGGRIFNKTLNDFGTVGYQVTDINYTTGELTLDTALAVAWGVGDVVSGYLPPANIGGDAIESRFTTVVLNGVQGKIKSSQLTVGIPKEFLPAEVGTEFPEEYAATVRKIAMNLDCVFRRAAVDKFYEGYLGSEFPVLLTMGKIPGKRVSFYMPRVKATMPTIQFDGPALGLQIPGSALGMVDGEQVGENSICIILE